MVLNAIFNFGIWIFEMIAEVMPPLSVAMYNTADTLAEVLSFGVWVIGDDMWITFMTLISAWLTFKLTWGLVLFIYRLLPFC